MYPSFTPSIANGTRLGHYQIVSAIGAGGMGEVYRAVDTRLDRNVAIKVLPRSLAEDPQLRTRLEREAKSISQLSHPNICALFDVGDGYLVMELLDGESLAERLKRGPLPLEQTLRVGTEIASALHCAHSRGIIHRDLKPGNVMLTRSGAKLLDFGLAKIVSEIPENADDDSPTMDRPLTEEGTIVGTYQYMSPEQLTGGAIDSRSDIFALGVLLYEMLAGRRPFQGATRTSVVAAILDEVPAPITQVNAAVPRALEKIINSCLAKQPEDRWQNAQDIALQLKALQGENTSEGTAKAGLAPLRRRWGVPALLTALALLAVTLTAAYFLSRRSVSPSPRIELGLIPPPGLVIDDFELSPGGNMVAMLASSRGYSLTAGRESSLWVRDLATGELHAVGQSEQAQNVCWSPDGESIAFIARNGLFRVAATGGPAILIHDGLGLTLGLTWGADEVILFSRDEDGSINRIGTAAGSALTVMMKPNRTSGPIWYSWPSFLPDGRHFLYLVDRNGRDRSEIFAGSVAASDPPRRIVSGAASNSIYSGGKILYVRDHTLMGAPFDVERLATTGPARVIAAQIADTDFFHYVLTAGGGSLGYSTIDPRSRLRLVDRTGRELAAFGEPADWVSVSWSPDGSRAILEQTDAERFGGTLWMADLGRGIFSQWAAVPRSRSGIWSSDGLRVVYQNDTGVFVKRADGSENVSLSGLGKPRYVTGWNGDWLAAEVEGKTNFADVEAISLVNNQHVPVATSPALEGSATFSPDGRWIAYVADGRVLVQPFPPTGAQMEISPSRGGYPRWRGDGRELYYYDAQEQIVAVSITPGDKLVIGTPAPLFTVRLKNFKNRTPYDVSPKGDRFLLNVQDSEDRAAHIVLHWSDDPRRSL
ncbi:MAG: protein kinase [Acidobacteriota bacterium]